MSNNDIFTKKKNTDCEKCEIAFWSKHYVLNNFPKGTDSSWIYYLLEIKLVKEINLLHHV